MPTALFGLIIGKKKKKRGLEAGTTSGVERGVGPGVQISARRLNASLPLPPFRACGGPGRVREGAVSGIMALAVTVPWDPLSSPFLPDRVLRDAPGVQVPRDVGLVHGAHVLDAAAHAACSGRRATRQIRWRLARTVRQPRQQPRLAGRAAALGARRPRAQAALPPRPRLL